MNVIISQVTILALLALIGAIVYKLKVLTDAGQQGIAKLVVNLTLPMLIISSILKIKIDVEILRNSIAILILAYCSLLILFLGGRIAAKFQRLSGYRADIHTICTMFGNIVFIGYPLFNAIYPGGEGVLYAAIYHLASDTLLWTFGVFMLNKSEEQVNSGKIFLKRLMNPNIIAFIVSIILAFFNIKLPYILDFTFSGIGSTTLYLAMLYIGAMLARNRFLKRAIVNKESYILSINKMFIIPAILLVLIILFQHLFDFEITEQVKTLIILQTAMPSMTIIAILVKEEGVEQVTSHIFINTIVSLISIPLIFYCLKFFV